MKQLGHPFSPSIPFLPPSLLYPVAGSISVKAWLCKAEPGDLWAWWQLSFSGTGCLSPAVITGCLTGELLSRQELRALEAGTCAQMFGNMQTITLSSSFPSDGAITHQR